MSFNIDDAREIPSPFPTSESKDSDEKSLHSPVTSSTDSSKFRIPSPCSYVRPREGTPYPPEHLIRPSSFESGISGSEKTQINEENQRLDKEPPPSGQGDHFSFVYPIGSNHQPSDLRPGRFYSPDQLNNIRPQLQPALTAPPAPQYYQFHHINTAQYAPMIRYNYNNQYDSFMNTGFIPRMRYLWKYIKKIW